MARATTGRPSTTSTAGQTPDPARFPRRHEAVADDIHSQGPQGRHLPAGRPGEGGVRRRQLPDLQRARLHHRRHRLPGPAHHQRLGQRVQAGLRQPLRAEVHRLASRSCSPTGAYDFLKLDGVGPGLVQDRRPNYDNTADVAAWRHGHGRHGARSTSSCPGRSTSATPPTGSSTRTAGGSTPTSSATATRWSAGTTRSRPAGTTLPPWSATPAPAAGTTSTRSTSATARWTASPRPSGRAT